MVPLPPDIYVHTHCRACVGTLEPFLALGNHRLNGFPKEAYEIEMRVRVPLTLCVCKECGLVQLDRTVPPDWMYRTYWYKSGVNEMMRHELMHIVTDACWEVEIATDDRVLDIGANDGTLLSYYPRGIYRVAVEPALNLSERLRPHCDELVADYWPHAEALEMVEGQYKIITAIACAYDTEDPIAFFQGIKDLLAQRGVALVQFQDFGQQLSAAAFDNICLPTGDRIVTPCGLRAIEQLKIGDAVYTHKGRIRRVIETFQREYDGDLVELRAYGMGHTLRVTPNHPVLVKRAEDWDWIPAIDLVIGDVVARPVIDDQPTVEALPMKVGDGRRPPELRMVNVDDLLELFGYYLAEGSIASNGDVLFYFGPEEERLAADCKARIEGLGIAARIGEHPTTLYVQAHGPLARLLEQQCGRGASNKHLAPWMFGLPWASIERLIRAYMAGDGYAYRENYLRASSVSEQLALDMAMLANCRGWKCSINEQDRPAECVIEGRVVSQLPLWDILIHTAPRERQKVWLEGRYQCARIREATRTPYVGDVWNIAVEDDNSYVSPGMTIHNCHEHLLYYTCWSLHHLVSQVGLQIWRVQTTPINGGSLRVWLGHTGRRPVDLSVTAQLAKEADQFLDTPTIRGGDFAAFVRFRDRVRQAKAQIGAVLDQTFNEGRVVDVYGASTKGNILLQVMGIGPSLVRQAIDRSAEKVGRMTITGIPIVSEETAKINPADVWLVPIWGFKDSVLARERWYLDQGGSMIFPLPQVEIIRSTWKP